VVKLTTRAGRLAVALALWSSWAGGSTARLPDARPTPPPAPSESVRELAHELAVAAVAHLDSARGLVLSAVEEIEGGAGRRRVVEAVWAEQFAPPALEAELAKEIGVRYPLADQLAAARWSASLPAVRLELARALAEPAPRASIDPDLLTGDDVERWRLADRMVDACDLFERGTALILSLNLHASFAALRLLEMPEAFVEERRQELATGLSAQLASNRSVLRERALRSTFVANRKAALEDLASELDFLDSAAGQSRCRAQADALELVLVRRIDELPRAVAAATRPS
jgi:hypothetical protein